jgi:tripartite-type tricarboxylate transporter receptor subunit TctC
VIVCKAGDLGHGRKIGVTLRKIWISFFALGALAMGALAANVDRTLADEGWPTRPVKIVLAYAAGGSPDLVARVLAQKLNDLFGESFFVENRTGANGNIGADYVAKAAPDGYTLLLATDNQFSVSPSLDSNLPYQVKDFAAVSLVADWYFFLAATPSLEANDLRELIALAKQKGPGKINYGSSGVGSIQELAMEWLQQLGEFKLTEIPYRGVGDAAPDLLAGRTQLMLTGIAGSFHYLRNKQLKALAVTSLARADVLPNVPTIAEQGFPGFEAPAYVGLYAPAGTPKEIIAKLQQQVAKATSAPDFRDRLLALSMNPVGSTPGALVARIDKDSIKWAGVLRRMHEKENNKAAQ